MELRHLRYFVAVAEEGQISRAAERLGIQQPPLSQQIKAIERQLGVQLFRRKARGVELTEAGRTFVEKARITIAHHDQAIEATQRTARGEQGRICVGIAPTAPFHPFVPRVIRAFQEMLPQVSLTLQECLTGELIERLRSERLDVAFIRTSLVRPQGLATNALLEEEMVVAQPSSRLRARSDDRGSSRAVSLKTLANETFIAIGRPHGMAIHDATIAACSAAGFTPRFGQEAEPIPPALNLVAAGLGVCLVPASLQCMKLDGVVYRRVKEANQPRIPLNLVSRCGDSSAVVHHFLKLVRRAAKDFSRDQPLPPT